MHASCTRPSALPNMPPTHTQLVKGWENMHAHTYTPHTGWLHLHGLRVLRAVWHDAAAAVPVALFVESHKRMLQDDNPCLSQPGLTSCIGEPSHVSAGRRLLRRARPRTLHSGIAAAAGPTQTPANSPAPPTRTRMRALPSRRRTPTQLKAPSTTSRRAGVSFPGRSAHAAVNWSTSGGRGGRAGWLAGPRTPGLWASGPRGSQAAGFSRGQ